MGKYQAGGTHNVPMHEVLSPKNPTVAMNQNLIPYLQMQYSNLADHVQCSS